jgi:DNA-binding response OmpR family regulator
MIRLYVVEDDRDLVWVLEESFQAAGYTVVTAENGLQALQKMRRQPPDLVVLDINMPVLNGFALAQRMSADPLLNGIPIIFLTGCSDFPSKLQGFRTGCDDYIVKPFDLAELHMRIEATLRRCLVKNHGDRDSIAVHGLTLNLASGQLAVDGRSVHLTEIEGDLLRYFIAHKGVPISAQQLLSEVLDFPPETGDLSTVRTHVRNLRHKIETDPDNPVYLCTVKPRGYCFHTS